MKNKGLIRFFSILLSLVCIYELSFTLVTYFVEKDAEEIASGDKTKENRYLDSIANEGVYNVFLKNFTYAECKEREIKLGLDLRGGMNVVLDISMEELLIALSNKSTDAPFLNSLKLAKEKQKESSADFITLFGQAFQETSPKGQLASIFSTVDLKDRISFSSTNEEVLAVLRDESQRAIDRAFNILRTRIDGFGVAQANIQKLEGSGKVIIELPGVTDVKRVRKLLQSTAQLEFWETHEAAEVFSALEQANDIIYSFLNEEEGENKEEVEDLETVSTSTSDTTIKKSDDDVAELLEKLGTTGEETGESSTSDSAVSQFSQNNPLFSLLQPPVFTNEQGQQSLASGPILGYAKGSDIPKIMEYFSHPLVQEVLPLDLKLAWTFKPLKNSQNVYQLIALKITTSDGSAPLGGEVVVSAREDFGESSATAEVIMKMNAEGTKAWKRLTTENKGKSIAILLDSAVYSFPTVQSEISGGVSNITGDFTLEEARDLANILQAGKLPAPARIIEEAVVGPTLGSESINAGIWSFVFALVVILIYMIFYYGNAGIIANVALLSNIFFIVGVLASFRATLTLPGIAGIVLTIGMSVDANVLIFERIREELRKGKSIYSAISDGFSNSISAIIDANLTTLLVGFVLMTFGTGPIRGFAVTLVTGIFTSLFTAVVISRMIFQYRLDKKSRLEFSSKSTKNLFSNVNIDFMKKRKVAYLISTVVIVVGLGSLFTRGLNLGVDFQGGRSYVVRFEEQKNVQNVRETLSESFGGNAPIIKVFGQAEQLKITTNYLINSEGEGVDDEVEGALNTGLEKLSSKYQIMSTQKVGPSIADDIKESAVYAIIIALIGIFLYILVRFGTFRYSLGAILALAHDVLFVLGLFSLFYGIMPFSMEVDQSFIAAILTVVGYSVNDSVIIFDRMRETISTEKKLKLVDSINISLNRTLSRTLNTSITVIFVLLAFFLFGGEVIRGFSFAILVGVIVGTYSSLFIAAPVVYDTSKERK